MRCGYCWSCLSFVGYMKDNDINRAQIKTHKKHYAMDWHNNENR